jgi:hypothetical protein
MVGAYLEVTSPPVGVWRSPLEVRMTVSAVYLFPSGIGIKRNIGQFLRTRHCLADDLWGGREWRELRLAKLVAGVGQLGYVCQDEGDPVLVNEGNIPMYHLLFFSKHLAGITLWRRIKAITPGGQRVFNSELRTDGYGWLNRRQDISRRGYRVRPSSSRT